MPNKTTSEGIQGTATIATNVEMEGPHIVICLCPHCGEFIDEEARACPKCGCVLWADELQKTAASDRLLESSNSIYLCASCGAFMGDEATTCPACGAGRVSMATKLGGVLSRIQSKYGRKSHADSWLETSTSLFICRGCGAFTHTHTKKCGICGMGIEDDDGEDSGPDGELYYGEMHSRDVLSSRGELTVCGHCGAFMSSDANSCSMCGVEKTVMIIREEIDDKTGEGRDETTSSALLMCDSCGAFIGEDAQVCSACGAEMTAEEPYDEDFTEVPVACEEEVVAPVDNMDVLKKMTLGSGTHPVQMTDDAEEFDVLDKMNKMADKKVKVKSPPKLIQKKERKTGNICKSFLLKKAVALRKLGKFNMAADCLNKALKLSPDDPNVIREKAYIYYITNRYEKAAELYKKLLEKEPNNTTLWNKLGNALFRMEHTKESQICYEKALNLDASNKEAQINRGYLFMKLKKYDEAMGYAEMIAA
ncbi:MAG: tetratricopeptide repeat protein [Thermoplasmata archaeon]|nr:MAG: tetratricopeptide repeat protein [Thermoplasmata archaeon]